MTGEQFARFKDFALRMAMQGWPHATPARKQRLHGEIADLIDSWELDADEIDGWDNKACVCDWVSEWAAHTHDHYRVDRKGREHERGNKFYTQVCCCIRAALDLTTESPSAGVLGFDVGDLRRMYDGTIPDWIAGRYGADLATARDEEGILL